MPRPPATDPLVALADQCVQCGLCLPACPTYRRDGLEPESPRGRIALARAWALGTIEPTAVGEAHMDHCLACRSCEAVCPAGVRFGALLVESRRRQRDLRRPGVGLRVLEWLSARPRVLSRLLGAYRALYPLLPPGLRLAPRPPRPAPGDLLGRAYAAPRRGADAAGVVPPAPGRSTPGEAAGHTGTVPLRPDPAAGEEVALFVGCAARAYEPPVRMALSRLATAAGLRIVVPAAQGCCGSLHAHAGATGAAAALAAANREALAGHRHVVTLASGCHEAVAAALHDASAAVDALELLAARRDRLAFRPSDETVALHLPCTQRHVVGSAPALLRLLESVPRTRIARLDAGFGCCGASGTRFLTDPADAGAYRAPLIAQLHAGGASRLLSANLGCRLHLQGATALPVEHPLEFVARHLDAAVPAPRLDSAP